MRGISSAAGIGIFLVAFVAVTQPALGSNLNLRASAEAFAGQTVMIDPRLDVPGCPGHFRFRWYDSSRLALLASCPAIEWQMIVPLRSGRPAGQTRPVVRRGDPVRVSANGPGYAVSLDAVAEADARAGGRIRVRNASSGRAIIGDLSSDGNVVLGTSTNAP